MLQLLIHLLGDFVLQSDYMALKKNENTTRCFIHVVLYTIPFLILTLAWKALLVIFVTHFLIDRFGLPKYLIYAKNHINPQLRYHPWKFCNKTGYFDTPINSVDDFVDRRYLVDSEEEIRPIWITVWLYIITDNGLHLAFNYLALTYLQ